MGQDAVLYRTVCFVGCPLRFLPAHDGAAGTLPAAFLVLWRCIAWGQTLPSGQEWLTLPSRSGGSVERLAVGRKRPAGALRAWDNEALRCRPAAVHINIRTLRKGYETY